VIALFNKGYALMMLQHYLEALEVSRRVLDLEPAHKEAAFNYGTCELYVGDVHRAISCLKAILECHPGHPPLLALLMVLELAVAEVKAADQQFRQLQAQNYRIADYVQARVVTLEGVGRTELAKAIRTAAVSLGLEL
jgi:tetratricopeptide (TPR) repeat protein